LRWLIGLIVALVIAVTTAVVVHVREDVLPPDCRDPRTLALVHSSLTGRFHLPASVGVSHIEMLAGGPLAFRFVCQADVEVDPALLPPGRPRPGFVHYTSQLTNHGHQQEVTVELSPLMIWEQVQ
jgi:hypothetical protein